MVLYKDVTIPLCDGAFVRADVWRPKGPGLYPAIISFGP